MTFIAKDKNYQCRKSARPTKRSLAHQNWRTGLKSSWPSKNSSNGGSRFDSPLTLRFLAWEFFLRDFLHSIWNFLMIVGFISWKYTTLPRSRIIVQQNLIAFGKFPFLLTWMEKVLPALIFHLIKVPNYNFFGSRWELSIFILQNYRELSRRHEILSIFIQHMFQTQIGLLY